MSGKLGRFIRKYDFPLHFPVIVNQHLIRRASVGFSSVLFKCWLTLMGCKFGKSLKVDGFPVLSIVRRGSISFGDNCKINSRFKSNLVGGTGPAVLECLDGGSIRIGNHSGLSFAVLSSKSGIVIGNHVNIGGNVRIFDHDYHSLDYLDRRDGALDKKNCRTKPVHIGDDVFIGTNSIILKGVTIGDRSIIGAGSVVAASIPSDEIWAGNPARLVKKIGANA